ncbi:hypothetical protein M407DRAFT_222112 [Tulasnella calospora MUT 4182]|uniref:Uncharacterized protein n=1 Tax=Tulasnella calospora MUT 4182 TaxID=1051891 RepID=A0A0C3QGW9_9AGAM|nr:hypothetical protein M407DRAFT_222112 [Tulasnella calospora MUT 4182]
MPRRNVDPPRTTPRPFDIEDCPAFYPTAEEWKDPMAYVKSISDRAKAYGICKIVPPEGWNMPFVIDTKTFSFKTRLQRLNSIEASSRAKINFLEQLYRFHQQQEAVGPVVPTINHKPLDLWLLRKEVHSRGGFDIVSRAKQWGEVARAMSYDGIVGVSTQLKNAYIRIILPFEQFSEHIRNSPSMSALSPEIRYPPTSPAAASRMGGRMGAANQAPPRMSRMRANPPPANGGANGKSGISASVSRTSTPLSISSSSLSEPSEEEKPNVRSEIKIEVTPAEDVDVTMNGVATTSTPLPRISTQKDKPPDYVQGDSCEVCNSGDKGTQMLLCDGCDHDPPLSYVPKGQWFCHICLFDTGGDYGFDEGEDHSLHSFQARDLAFRKAWFEAHRPPPPPEGHNDPYRYKVGDVELGEDDVEREFWRLVESPLETVEIEYGADVHSTTHGSLSKSQPLSASPSLETHPLDPYSKDGWNMNNMPIVSDSLLRYVKSDISGMTVPWVYVGMVFSTFCWHNEDHYTYSVNYMHWGETKTWYGIPGDDAEKFEAAIKSEAPDLFEAQPDLLLREMIDGHLTLRKKLRQAVPNIPEVTEEQDVPEDQYQCAVCKGFSYLAQVTCQCTKQVACLEHWTELCGCLHTNRTLRKRFDDDQLLAILRKVRERSTAPITWRRTLQTTLAGPEKPELITLRSLAKDATEMEVTLPEYPNLRKFVDRANHIVERALDILRDRPLPTFRKYLPRKQTNEVQPLSDGEYDAQDVVDLLREADELWFDSSEMRDLVKLDKWAAGWDQRAGSMIAELHRAGPNAPLDRAAWDALLFEAYGHNYRLGRFEDVGRVAKRIRFLEELRAVQDTPLTMEDVEELQKQAVNCSLPSDNEQAVKLKELAERGTQWCKYAHMVLDTPVIALEDLNKLVAPPCSVPVFPSLLERIDSVRGRAREIEKQAKAILYPSVGRRTPISEALRLVSTTQKDFLVPAVQILAEVAPQAAHIEKTCFDIINNRYSPQASHKPLFEELRDMRNTVQKKLWMFTIPSFDIVDQQLVQHDAWLEKLPWYRTPEPAMQGKLIVDDVVQNTRPEDDKPPSDPECTCICPLPVKVTVEKQADAVQCDHCGAKFHSKCIEGSCPFCDHHHWNGSLTKTRNFEYIDLLPIARAAPDLTRNYSLAWKHMDIIITYVDRLTRAIDMFLGGVNEQNINPAPPNFIPQTRHFLRKLYKMQFSIKARADIPSYGLTLCHVHRLLANNTKATQDASQKKKAQRRPKFIFTAEVMPLANDGSRCLCKGSHVGHRLITCNSCSYNFHGYCVRYDEANNPAPKPWRCPMCMIRKGKQYPQSAVRVRTVAEQEADVYVDTKACLENYSWQLIRQRLPPPTDYTIILELERFIPGSNQYPESSLAAKPPAPASQPQSSAGSSTPIPREPSRTPKPAAPSGSASTSGSASQPPAASSSSSGSSRAIMPSPAYIAPSVSKRKAPTSPAAENPRRLKLLFREGDKANDEATSRAERPAA